MFRAAYHSSSGALTIFAASGLHRHVVTGRSQVGIGKSFPCLGIKWNTQRHLMHKHSEVLLLNEVVNIVTIVHSALI